MKCLIFLLSIVACGCSSQKKTADPNLSRAEAIYWDGTTGYDTLTWYPKWNSDSSKVNEETLNTIKEKINAK